MTNLSVRRFETPEEFAESAMLYLLRHEAEHCLMIGLVAQAIENPHRWDGPVTFATVEREGTPLAFAIRTPPHNVVLSRVADPDAIPFLVDLWAHNASYLFGFLGSVVLMICVWRSRVRTRLPSET